MVEPHIYSLSELADDITEALYELAPEYWVEAEIASVQERGHCYMELVQKGDRGEFAARARATCWQTTWRSLSALFVEQTGTRPAAGMRIRMLVSVEYHPVYGLSLNIHDIDPSCTLGELARLRQQTLLRLEQEGLMDLQRALVLPTLVHRLAVISSESAAGYQDFVHQLLAPGYRISATLFPAIMQGDSAGASILAALQAIAAVPEEFDAVVIIRGGGATADLSCFDGYDLARACALFPLPVLTGVGHTRDVSVLDSVVFCALKTPTAVADFFLSRFAQQEQRLADLQARLRMVARLLIQQRRHHLDMLTHRLELANPERIYRMGYSLLTADGRVVRSAQDVRAGQALTTHLLDGVVHSVAQDAV